MADKHNIENAVRTLIDSAVSKANESVPGVMEVSDTGFNIAIHMNKIPGKINMYADDQNDLYFENLGNGMFNRSGYADFDDFHDGEPIPYAVYASIIALFLLRHAGKSTCFNQT